MIKNTQCAPLMRTLTGLRASPHAMGNARRTLCRFTASQGAIGCFAKRNGCRAVIPVFHFAPKPVDSRLRTIEPTRRVRGENAAMQKRYGLGWATVSDTLA